MGINKVGPRVKILSEIAKLKNESSFFNNSEHNFNSQEWSLAFHSFDNLLEVEKSLNFLEESDQVPLSPSSGNASPSSSSLSFFKRRKLSKNSPPSIVDLSGETMLSVYVFMSHIIKTDSHLKKVLFMVKSKQSRTLTENIVSELHSREIARIKESSLPLSYEESHPQLLLILQPNKTGNWIAVAQPFQKVWNFQKGDFIKIDNCHSCDISILVHHYFITENNEPYSLQSQKYPILFPGGSLQIGVDENKDGRLSLAKDFVHSEDSETFAVMQNGKLVSMNQKSDACIFSFSRSNC